MENKLYYIVVDDKRIDIIFGRYDEIYSNLTNMNYVKNVLKPSEEYILQPFELEEI